MRTLTHEKSLAASAARAGATTVLVVDDHQAVRLGIQMLLDDEPGIEVVASAGSFSEGLEAARRWAPDVAVVDYHLPGRDGLTLTRKLARMPRPPQVLVFSAYADQRLELAALLAGADAVLSKNTLGLELCQQIGSLARGRTQHFSIETRALAAVSDELEVEDRPILGMLAAGTHPDEIIEVLGLSRDELESRRSAMLQRLKAPSRLSGAGTQTDRKE